MLHASRPSRPSDGRIRLLRPCTALEVTESFFWSYCDDYLELVKARSYGEPSEAGPRRPARAGTEPVGAAELFAPFLPTAPRRHGRGGSPARSWFQLALRRSVAAEAAPTRVPISSRQ